MKGGFFFQINDEQIERWNTGMDARVCPDGAGVDCGAMVLSFLGLSKDIVYPLQQLANRRGGLTLEQLVKALSQVNTKEFVNLPDYNNIYAPNFDNIPDLVDFLYNNLPHSHGVISFGQRADDIGHFIILARDSNGILYMIDPQNSLMVFGDEIIAQIEMHKFTNIKLLISSGCDFTRLNLYKDGRKFQRIFGPSLKKTVFAGIKKNKKKTKKQNKRKSSKKGKKSKTRKQGKKSKNQ